MEGEEESKPKLPLNKVLELLIPKVQPGHTIPDPLVTPPWRLPSSTSENAAKINSILNKSMEIQSSKIPDSDDFENFIISNSCLAIAGLLKYYLQSLNFAPNAKVMFGVLLWDANARDGPDDFEGNLFSRIFSCFVKKNCQITGRQTFLIFSSFDISEILRF